MVPQIFPIPTRSITLEDGRIIIDGTVVDVGRDLISGVVCGDCTIYSGRVDFVAGKPIATGVAHLRHRDMSNPTSKDYKYTVAETRSEVRFSFFSP